MIPEPDVSARASSKLSKEIRGCRLCAVRFKETHSRHLPRPVVWFRPEARLLVAGQAPGARVHETGRPFTDASGDRLRAWMGISEEDFYDLMRVAIVPMAFCFPGYNEKKSDLPPPPICARTWHARVLRELSNVRLSLLVGGYAQRYHLGAKSSVTATVNNWRSYGPDVFPLPHPSWRNTAWIKKNPWFETDLLPVLQARVKELMQ